MSHTHSEFRRPAGVKVTYRRVKLPFEDTGFPRYWHDGSPFKSLFWSQLSTSFEAGERFFIDSARALKGHVEDEALLEELQEFCKQEGHHTQQHLKFDRMNAAHGLDVESCRERYAFILELSRRRLNPLGQLAVTVALEHFTSCFSQQHFERPELSAGADPNVQALWDWHAAEETEHKATCFDVYRAAGGGYWRRVAMLPLAWSIILGISLWNTASLLRADRQLFTRDTLSGLRYLFGKGGMVRGLMPAFVAYLSPRWQPWEEDNSAEIARWEREQGHYRAPSARSNQLKIA